MVNLTGPLAKLLKKTRLVILAVDDDSSQRTDLIKVELPEAIRVKGSNALPNGKDMYWAADTLQVAAEDITLFQAGCKEVEENGKTVIVYEGPLKLDVSRPKGRMENGTWVWKQQPRLWLVSVPFNRRGSELIQESQESMRGALNVLFTPPEETPEDIKALNQAAKNTTAAGEAEPPKVEDKTGGAGGDKGRKNTTVTGG